PQRDAKNAKNLITSTSAPFSGRKNAQKTQKK
ncbi:unnamed protein product, partial [marine sediment metagenome]